MLKLRLTRTGTKDKAQYRIIVQEARSKRDGRYVENLGYYNPRTEPSTIVVKLDRVDYWMKNGAQPTDSVASLLKRARVSAGEIDATPVTPAPVATAPRAAMPATVPAPAVTPTAVVATVPDAISTDPAPASDFPAATVPAEA